MNSVFTIVVILIILLIVVYNKLSKRIDLLEKQIADLSKKTIVSPIEEAVEKNINEEPIHTFNEKIAFQNLKTSTEEFEEPAPQKDWLTPVFDFLKQNALTIIGIFTLVLGIGYFVNMPSTKTGLAKPQEPE